MNSLLWQYTLLLPGQKDILTFNLNKFGIDING